MNLFPKIAGVIQADADVDLKNVFGEVYKTAENNSHPMLLPIQLFEDHFFTSLKQFQTIIKNINYVESKIQMELTCDQTQSDTSLDNSKGEYGELSKETPLL
jgi:hypothetical protein